MSVEDNPAIAAILKRFKGEIVEIRGGNMQTETQVQPARPNGAVKPPKQETPRPEVGRPWLEIYQDLRKDIPAAMLSTRVQQGTEIVYCAWTHIVKMLHWYAPGFSYHISLPVIHADFVTVKASIVIPTAEGDKTFEALGTEPLYEYRRPKGNETADETGYVRTRSIGYGAAPDRAESAALRRAAAKAGFGIALWEKD